MLCLKVDELDHRTRQSLQRDVQLLHAGTSCSLSQLLLSTAMQERKEAMLMFRFVMNGFCTLKGAALAS